MIYTFVCLGIWREDSLGTSVSLLLNTWLSLEISNSELFSVEPPIPNCFRCLFLTARQQTFTGLQRQWEREEKIYYLMRKILWAVFWAPFDAALAPPIVAVSVPPHFDGAIGETGPPPQFDTTNLDPGFYDTQECITLHWRNNNGEASIKWTLCTHCAIKLISDCHSLSDSTRLSDNKSVCRSLASAQ